MTTHAEPQLRAARRTSLLRLLAVPLTVAVVLLGVWVTGGLLTNDFALAMWLSVAWMACAGLLAFAIAARARTFAWPVLGTYVLTAAALGLYLGSSVFLDSEVNERVATASARPASGAAAPAGENLLLGEGRFQPVRHAVRGEARTIELADGGRVLTLTRFEVDNGPDLRVYLVAGPATTEKQVDDLVDLGALKGNRGNQQYAVPARVDLERYSTVVIWCRAFSVLFARAPLRS